VVGVRDIGPGDYLLRALNKRVRAVGDVDEEPRDRVLVRVGFVCKGGQSFSLVDELCTQAVWHTHKAQSSIFSTAFSNLVPLASSILHTKHMEQERSTRRAFLIGPWPLARSYMRLDPWTNVSKIFIM
jgi:acyl-coenzyme A thioesterase PaaI-like protein